MIALYAIIIGLNVGVGCYVFFAPVFEEFAKPWFVKPGEPMSFRSYGQEFAFIMAPIAASFGAALGLAIAFAAHRRWLIGSAIGITAAGWVSWVVSRMWIENHREYGFDLSDWVLYFPLLVGAGVVVLAIVVFVAWRLLRKNTNAGDIHSRSAKWLVLRIALLLLCFEGGLVSFWWGVIALRFAMLERPQLEAFVDSFGSIIVVGGFLAAPLCMVGALFLSAKRLTDDEYWSLPTFFCNPLDSRHPLCCFRFSAFLLLAIGLGGFKSSLGDKYGIELYALLSGLLSLAGVYLVIRLFQHKVRQLGTANQQGRHDRLG